MANITAAERAKRQKEMEKKIKQKNAELEAQKKELENKIKELESTKAEPTPVEAKEVVEPKKDVVYVNTWSKMDMPCSIIHMRECTPKLPTTFNMNNNTHYFTYFGERKTFRYQDMQDILSKYRSLFEAGLFCLAEDCEALINEIPSDVCTIVKDDRIFNKITTMSIEDFKKVVGSFNQNQIVNIAQTYKIRNEKKMPGYDDLEKIKFLNKKSGGLLNSVLEKLQKKDNDKDEE